MTPTVTHAASAVLALVLLLGGSVAPGSPVSLYATSDSGRLRAGLELDGRSNVPVGEHLSWLVRLSDADGRPVDGASIVVGGGMAGHGHGLPTSPRVTAALGGGVYLVEGVKFSMAGAWTLVLRIDVAGVADSVRFPLQVGTVPAPPAHGSAVVWTPEQVEVLRSLSLSAVDGPPRSPGNRVADDPRAARLGRRLFSDPRLSGSGDVACTTCHLPERYYTDGRPRSRGTGTTLRNAPTVVGAAYQSWFYWDGRRDSLWSQALIPLEAPEEMGSTRADVVAVIRQDPDYLRLYTSIFGENPGKRGAALDRAFANVGKALEAYERTLEPPVTRFDRYVATLIDDGEAAAEGLLTVDEIAGLKLFLDDGRTRCLRCHNGPMLRNDSFHNIGTGNFEGDRLDYGRAFGLQSARLDPFNCLGEFSDADPEECTALRFANPEPHVPLEGAFKVPTLRGAPDTAPYFHDGSRPSLDAVIEHYAVPPQGSKSNELQPIQLTVEERAQLRAFLGTLTPRP